MTLDRTIHTDSRPDGFRASGLAIGLLATGVLVALAAPASIAAEDHGVVRAGEVEWSPGPASLPPGAEAAVLYGDPGTEGLFALRLKLPPDYRLPAHTHPKPEIVTVVSGTFHLGTGDEAKRDDTQALEAGSFFAFAPGMAHYAHTEEETVIQLNSTGPWSLDYVDPEDDPRKQ